MKKAKTIISIGGGKWDTVLHIDKRIVKATGKKSPKLLFIPTASNDDEAYITAMEKRYVQEIGCDMKTLTLLKKEYSQSELKNLVSEADIIYVGGGNTLMMMRKWRRLGIEKLLKKAWESGTVMCGVSAGSICWFESGHSDSMWYYHPKKWNYIRVRGLNILPFIHCPHFDSETGGKKRKNDFKALLKKYPNQIGITCDDSVAIEWRDGEFKVLSEKPNAHAYKVHWKKGRYHEETLKNRMDFEKIEILKNI